MLRQAGGEPPEFKRDAKGFLIEGMTAVMSKVGTRGALMAMTENELLTNLKYKLASGGDFSPDVLQLIKRNYADEKRHLGFITKAMKEKFGLVRPSVTVPTQDNLEESLNPI